MIALYIGLGLILGAVLGLIVAYVARPKEQSSNVGGFIKLIGGIASI